jgi:hypothetical protein
MLVSASWSQGRVASLEIFSEKGAPCRLYSPWPGGFRVASRTGKPVAVTADAFGRPEFATEAGSRYFVTPK